MNYKEIPKGISERLQNGVGSIVSSIQDSTYVGVDGTRMRALVLPEDSVYLKLDDIVLVYDYLRGEIFASKIIGHSTHTIDDTKITDKLLTLKEDSGYELHEGGRRDFLRTPHLFTLDPVVKVRLEEEEELEQELKLTVIGAVDFAPSEKATLFLPTMDEMFSIFEMSEEGISIACMGRENELKVFVDKEGESHALPIKIPEELFNRHVSFNGTTGSGKTVALKGLIAQLYKRGSSILLTDTQGDYVLHLIKRGLSEDQKEVIERNKVDHEMMQKALGLNYEERAIDPKDIIIWYPPIINSRNSRVLNYLEKIRKRVGFSLNKLHLSSSLISSWGTLATTLPKLSDVQSDGLSLIFSEYIKRKDREKKPFKLNEFIYHLETNRAEIMEVGGIKEMSLRPILRSLKTLQTLEILDRVSEQESLRYEDMFQPGKISILYLPRDTEDPKISLTRVTPLIQLLMYQLVLRNKYKSDFQRVIILDEAQNIIPNERFESSKGIAKELARQFEVLAREGRKNNFSLIVASQEPSRINSTVFKQCATRIFLRLPHQDIKGIEREIDSQYRNMLPRLRVGSGIIHSPDAIKIGQIWGKFPMPPVFHESIFKTIESIKRSEEGVDFEERLESETSRPFIPDETPDDDF